MAEANNEENIHETGQTINQANTETHGEAHGENTAQTANADASNGNAAAPPTYGQDSRYRHHRHGPLSGAIFGLWIVLLGVVFLLQNLGIIYIGHVWQFWPLILVGMGLSHMIGSYYTGGKIWGAFLAGVGVLILLSNLRLLPAHIWNYIWPLALVFWGVRMLIGGPRCGGRFNRFNGPNKWQYREENFRQRQQWREQKWQQKRGYPMGANPAFAGESYYGKGDETHAGGFHATTSKVANRLNEYAILGGVKRRIDSQEFEGGECTAVMGGIELDLTRAATKLDEVVIEANALMGGVELRVPADWEVVVHGAGIMGGYDDSTRPPVNLGTGAKRPRLLVTGQALWGGVTVKN